MNTPDLQGSLPAVIAIENESYRKRFTRFAQEVGFRVELTGKPNIIYQMTREQYATAWVLLDTDDDIARMVQLVNDYHRSLFHCGGSAPITCMVSIKANKKNRLLGWWLIDGAAAVMNVMDRDDRDAHTYIRNIFRSWTEEPTPDIEPIPERPTYDELVTRVLQSPNEGQRLFELGVRLGEWQHSHLTMREVSRAFLRHATLQMPDSVEAHQRYGAALSRTQLEEALFHLREAIRLAPDDPEGYLLLGQALIETNREEAVKALRKAVQLDPDALTAKQALNVMGSRFG